MGHPIDTPTTADFMKKVELYLQDDPNVRQVLQVLQGLKHKKTYSDIKRDVRIITSSRLKREPKLIRDLNAVLPPEFTIHVLCPPVNTVGLEFIVLLGHDRGEILSTSALDGCRRHRGPSSTEELRNVLPLTDEWESIEETCLTSPQWGSCLQQLLKRECDDPRLDEDYRRLVLRRSTRLWKKARVMAPSLFLLNVAREEGLCHGNWGGFADVYKAAINGNIICMKILRVYQSDDMVKNLKIASREVLTWSRLSHPNILPFLGAQLAAPRFALISPWMSNGNLSKFLEAHPGHDRLLACFEVSSGLKYLHGLNPHVYHRDIKAVNILVKDDGVCCLGDFGLSSIAGSQRLESKSFAGQGTMHWQPPEVVLADSTVSFEHNLDSAAADVYAYGCMVHEVYTGTHPFSELKQGALIRALAEKKRPTLDAVDAAFEISKQLRALINSCWNDAPERPTMSRINSEIEKELKSYFCSGCDACLSSRSARNLEWRQLKSIVGSTSPSQSEPILTGVLSEESWGGPANPVQSLSSGLMTPPASGNDSPVIAEPLGNTRFEITEERDSTGMDVLGIVLPRSEIRGTSRSLTPPETPTRTLEKIQLSPHSPPFCPSPGLKIRAHRLNLDAAEFTPRGFTKNPLNWQAKEFVPLGNNCKEHFVGKDSAGSTLDASSRGLNPHARTFIGIRASPTRIVPS